MNVLLVDDSTTARLFVRRCLEMSGLSEAEFFEAEHGKEALAVLKVHEIQLVIADLNMPLMNGKSLLKWMKTNKQYSHIPVIFITSAKNEASEMELLSLGAQEVLKKPISPANLAPVIEPWVQM